MAFDEHILTERRIAAQGLRELGSVCSTANPGSGNTLGDSLLERIDYGLERSKFGITILSRNFFRKKWTRRELTGLATRELQGERTIILPIWHNVTAAEVASFSLLLADRKAVDTSEGIDRIAMQVLQKFAASHPGVELRYALEAIRVRRGSETDCMTDSYVFRPG